MARRFHRVGIVGAGLAGLTAAVACAAAGAHVDVFDAADGLAAPPAHINVVPNLMRELVGLGLAERCVRAGFPYHGVSFLDADGRSLFELPTPALAGAHLPSSVGMRYGDLLRIVRDAALDHGVATHWRSRVCAIEASPSGSRIALDDGREVAVDLAVLAGARGVRGVAMAIEREADRLPQRWDHVLMRRPRGLDRATWVIGPDAKALLVPVDVHQTGLALLRDERTAHEHATRPLRDVLMAARGLMRTFAALVDNEAPVIARPVMTGMLSGPWHDGLVLRIGSSAHLLPPHFGQAGAQSVEDAVVLGALLRDAASHDELFVRFMARRAGRAARVHALTTQAARWDLTPEPATDLSSLARQLTPLVEQPA